MLDQESHKVLKQQVCEIITGTINSDNARNTIKQEIHAIAVEAINKATYRSFMFWVMTLIMPITVGVITALVAS